jgi:hypothetical protein
MLLVLVAVLVLGGALAANAFALPTFTAGSGATPACQSCHGSSGPAASPDIHNINTTHSALVTGGQCATCHNNGGTGNPPLPTACGACHQGLNHIVLEPTHSTKGCTTCHPVSAVISSITPSHATVGTSVTIAGTGFGAVKGTGAVKFGTTAASVTSWSGTSIVVTVPAALSPGAVNVTVTRTDGTASGASAFTVDSASPTAPVVAGVAPGSGIVGAKVTLTGTGFTGATGVTFNNVAATTFTVVSDTKITVKVPAGASTGPVAVTTGGGTGTSAKDFTVLAPTTITLKLSGLTAGVLKRGKIVTATGKVTPLRAGQVTITLQKKKAGKWVNVKVVRKTMSVTGTYKWAYRAGTALTARGSYRMHTKAPTTALFFTRTSVWRNFTVR